MTKDYISMQLDANGGKSSKKSGLVGVTERFYQQ